MQYCIDTQLKSLQNRVAYSTITLELEAAVSTPTSQQSLELQVENTWNNATQSVVEFTTDLLGLAIWLLAYSPYLLVFGGITWLIYNRCKKPLPQPATQASDSQLTPDGR